MPVDRVSVIIPLKDKAPFVEACVDSVIAAASRLPGRCEIMVVDNLSTDGGRALVAAREKQGVRLLDVPLSTIGAVRNAGAAKASGDVLWFLDADCVAAPDHLLTLARLFDDPALIVSGCRVRYPLDRSWIERTWHQLHYRPTDGTRKYINSGNLVVRAKAFHSVGGFSETLVTGEDADLGERLRAVGVISEERQALAVTHLDNPRTLRAFFRKEVWHAHGSSADFRSGKLDAVSISAFLHVIFCLAALLLAVWFLRAPALWAGVLAAALPWVIPGMTVAFRVRQVRRLVNPLQALILYQVYFLARAKALFI